MAHLKVFVSIILVIFSSMSSAQAAWDWKTPLTKAVEDRIAAHQFMDGAIGVVTKNSADITTYGHAAADTIFEIGSITKAFTGIIFAQMVLEKKLDPSNTVDQYVPELKGTFSGQIMLSELASHTSGLSRVPEDLPKTLNPYITYDRTQLLNYLKKVPSPNHARPFPIDYSNTGFALLGFILTRIEGVSYSDLVTRRVTDVLGMSETSVVIKDSQADRFIQGHDADLLLVPHWDFSVFAPAGALRSTLVDMMKFAKANLNPDSSTILGQAIQLSQNQSWGWDTAKFNFPFFYKNGGTGGFKSVFLIDPKRDFAIAILTNTSIDADGLIVPIIKSKQP